MSLRANIGTPTPAWSCRPDTHSIGRTAALSKQTSALDELYGYDGLNRLTSFQRGTITGTWPDLSLSTKVQKRQWLLEALGNWRQFQVNSNYADDEDYTDAGDLDQARTHNKVNEIHNATAGAAITEGTSPQQAAWVDPVHDAAGNMTQAPLAGSSGDLSAGQTRLHLVYDAWNRQVKVYTDDGDGNLEAGGDDAQRLECAYDGLGQRIIKVDKTGQSEVTYHYYYNEAWQVLEERVGDDPDPYAQYAWDARYIDAPVVRWRDTTSPPDGQVDETLYFTNDANMNVTAAVDASSTVQERYTYDAYGTPTFRDGSWNAISWANSRKNEILFCGYRYDPQTGYYHVRHRVYLPDLGRWGQRDPTEYQDGPNLYQAMAGNAVRYIDAFGLANAQIWEEAQRKAEKEHKEKCESLRTQMDSWYRVAVDFGTRDRPGSFSGAQARYAFAHYCLLKCATTAAARDWLSALRVEYGRSAANVMPARNRLQIAQGMGDPLYQADFRRIHGNPAYPEGFGPPAAGHYYMIRMLVHEGTHWAFGGAPGNPRGPQHSNPGQVAAWGATESRAWTNHFDGPCLTREAKDLPVQRVKRLRKEYEDECCPPLPDPVKAKLENLK